jgi:hypothetical protein
MKDKREPPKVNVGARVPFYWAEEYKELANNIGCSQTELITETIGCSERKTVR